MQQTTIGFVIAITDQQTWRVVTSIERHSMRGVELFEFVSFDTEMFNVFAGLIVFDNVIAGVSVREEDITIGCNGNGSWVESCKLQSRFFRHTKS